MLLELTKTASRILYLLPLQGNDITSITTNFKNIGSLVGNATYSYSFDDVNWSTWLSPQDFITNLSTEDNQSLTTYLRVLITVGTKSDVTYSVRNEQYCGVECVLINGVARQCCAIEYTKDVNFIRAEDSSNKFNPYRSIDSAHHIREQLADAVSMQFGHVGTYFKTVADEETKSILFKSYRLYNSLEPKQLKVMLSEDDYNSDVQSFQFFGDYENLEIEIVKSEWKRVFGDMLPTPKDSLYINLFSKMFRVVSVKEDRNFMNKAVAYKFYLGVYQDSVDVNTKNVDDKLDNFTEFLAFDLENSEHAKAEIADATMVHDEVEHFKEDVDTQSHNDSSNMLYYSKGMKNEIATLTYNGHSYLTNMYHEPKTSIKYMTKYDISKAVDDKYSTSCWFKISELSKAVKLIDIGTDEKYGEQIYVNSNGLMAVHINGAEVNKYVTAVGTPIVKDGYYGVMYSRMGTSVVISVLQNVNGTVTKIQEIVESNIKTPSPRTHLNIHASKFSMIGNIRFMKKSITNSKLIPYMVDRSPSAKDSIVIDNCVAVTEGIKVKGTY